MNFRPSLIGILIAMPTLMLSAPSAFSQDDGLPVTTLIKRLGSEDFAQRQSASKLLFEKGRSILPELKKVPLSSNPELNHRVSDLIKLISNDADDSIPQEIFDAILKFENAEFETRKQLLKRLISGEHYDMYFRMLERLPADQADDIFQQIRLRQLIPTLCEKERWDVIDSVLSHPLTWKHEPNLCGLYHRTMGTFEVHLDRMKREIDESEFVDAGQLSTLIGFLKAEKDFATALRYAKRFGSIDLINAYECQILMESGNWKALAQRAVIGDGPHDSDRFFQCNRLTYPIVKYWGGTEEDFHEAMKKVSEKPDSEEDEIEDLEDASSGDGNVFSVDPILQQIYLLTLDWEQAANGIEIAEDQNSISLLTLLNQHELLFEKLKIGSDFSQHQQWANDQQEDIAKIVEGLSGTRLTGNRRNRRKQLDEIERKLGYYLSICNTLAELGLESEATLFIRQLYQVLYPVFDLQSNRMNLIGRVAAYGDAAALWNFIDNAGLTNVQIKSFIDTRTSLGGDSSPGNFALFENKSEVAEFVYQKLSDKFIDRLKLLKFIAHVVNYQLKPPQWSSPGNSAGDHGNPTLGETHEGSLGSDEEFNLDAAIGMIEHNGGSEASWHIGQIYAYHQRPEYKQWQNRAAFEGDARAIQQIARDELHKGNYLIAAKLFQQEFERSFSPVSLSQAAEAYGLAGDNQKEKRLRFHAFVLPSFIYDNNYDETYGGYVDEERTDLIADRLLFQIATNPQDDHSYTVAYAWQVLKNHDPVAAANLLRMRLLATSLRQPPLRLLLLSSASHTLDATSDVLQGNYAAAQKKLARLLKFSPATPSIAEEVVVQLDLAGQHEIGDQIIRKLAGAYHEVLGQYPSSPTHCNNYAWLLACGKRHTDAAIGNALIAVQRRPNSAGFIDTLAESYFADGQFDKAIKTIDRAIAIDPSSVYYRNQRQKYQVGKSRQ